MNSHDNTWTHVRHRGRIVSKLGDLGLAEKSTNTTSDVTSSLAESLSFQICLSNVSICPPAAGYGMTGFSMATGELASAILCHLVSVVVRMDLYGPLKIGYCFCKIRRKPTVMLFCSPFGRFLARMGRMNLTLLCTCIVVSLHGISIMQPACLSCLWEDHIRTDILTCHIFVHSLCIPKKQLQVRNTGHVISQRSTGTCGAWWP